MCSTRQYNQSICIYVRGKSKLAIIIKIAEYVARTKIDPYYLLDRIEIMNVVVFRIVFVAFTIFFFGRRPSILPIAAVLVGCFGTLLFVVAGSVAVAAVSFFDHDTANTSCLRRW